MNTATVSTVAASGAGLSMMGSEISTDDSASDIDETAVTMNSHENNNVRSYGIGNHQDSSTSRLGSISSVAGENNKNDAARGKANSANDVIMLDESDDEGKQGSPARGQRETHSTASNEEGASVVSVGSEEILLGKMKTSRQTLTTGPDMAFSSSNSDGPRKDASDASPEKDGKSSKDAICVDSDDDDNDDDDSVQVVETRTSKAGATVPQRATSLGPYQAESPDELPFSHQNSEQTGSSATGAFFPVEPASPSAAVCAPNRASVLGTDPKAHDNNNDNTRSDKYPPAAFARSKTSHNSVQKSSAACGPTTNRTKIYSSAYDSVECKGQSSREDRKKSPPPLACQTKKVVEIDLLEDTHIKHHVREYPCARSTPDFSSNNKVVQNPHENNAKFRPTPELFHARLSCSRSAMMGECPTQGQTFGKPDEGSFPEARIPELNRRKKVGFAASARNNINSDNRTNNKVGQAESAAYRETHGGKQASVHNSNSSNSNYDKETAVFNVDDDCSETVANIAGSFHEKSMPMRKANNQSSVGKPRDSSNCFCTETSTAPNACFAARKGENSLHNPGATSSLATSGNTEASVVSSEASAMAQLSRVGSSRAQSDRLPSVANEEATGRKESEESRGRATDKQFPNEVFEVDDDEEPIQYIVIEDSEDEDETPTSLSAASLQRLPALASKPTHTRHSSSAHQLTGSHSEGPNPGVSNESSIFFPRLGRAGRVLYSDATRGRVQDTFYRERLTKRFSFQTDEEQLKRAADRESPPPGRQQHALAGKRSRSTSPQKSFELVKASDSVPKKPTPAASLGVRTAARGPALLRLSTIKKRKQSEASGFAKEKETTCKTFSLCSDSKVRDEIINESCNFGSEKYCARLLLSELCSAELNSSDGNSVVSLLSKRDSSTDASCFEAKRADGRRFDTVKRPCIIGVKSHRSCKKKSDTKTSYHRQESIMTNSSEPEPSDLSDEEFFGSVEGCRPNLSENASGVPSDEESEEEEWDGLVDSDLEDLKTGYCLDPENVFVKKCQTSPYTRREFERMFDLCLAINGTTIQEIEKGKYVRNEKTAKSINMQYGRALPLLMKTIFQRVFENRIGPGNTFLDIGHGIGTTCLQAAYTYGCNAKGIECDEGRNLVAVNFDFQMRELAEWHKTRDGMQFCPGEVRFQEGELQNPRFREFQVRDTDFAFCNNFGGVFTAERGGLNLDRHVAGIFALMKPGAVLVTLAPLMAALGCQSLTKMKERRRKRGLSYEDGNASFYEISVFELGAQSEFVSWSEGHSCNKAFKVYRYTRLAQPAGESAVFLCNNVGCPNAHNNTPIHAVCFDSNGAPYIGTCDSCGVCEKATRIREKVSYKGTC